MTPCPEHRVRLDWLHRLARHPGPFATVVTHAGHDGQDGQDGQTARTPRARSACGGTSTPGS